MKIVSLKCLSHAAILATAFAAASRAEESGYRHPAEATD